MYNTKLTHIAFTISRKTQFKIHNNTLFFNIVFSVPPHSAFKFLLTKFMPSLSLTSTLLSISAFSYNFIYILSLFLAKFKKKCTFKGVLKDLCELINHFPKRITRFLHKIYDVGFFSSIAVPNRTSQTVSSSPGRPNISFNQCEIWSQKYLV